MSSDSDLHPVFSIWNVTKWSVTLESQKCKHLANCSVNRADHKSNKLPAGFGNILLSSRRNDGSWNLHTNWSGRRRRTFKVMILMNHVAFTVFQETTITEIKQKIMKIPDANGIVIDGFPRDVGQALSFEDQVSFTSKGVFILKGVSIRLLFSNTKIFSCVTKPNVTLVSSANMENRSLSVSNSHFSFFCLFRPHILILSSVQI